MEKEKIYEKAREILKKKDIVENYLKVCISANICPECGERLLFKSKQRPMPEYDYLAPGIYGIWSCSNCNYRIDYESRERIIGINESLHENTKRFNQVFGF